jgi:hypothetical protein
MYTLRENGKYLLTDQKKSSIDYSGEIKKWSYGDIITATINDIEHKYCYIHKERKKYQFIRHDFFVDYIKEKNNRSYEARNSPEALFLANYVLEIKKQNKCCVCGCGENPRVLVFDHIEPSKKKHEISRLVTRYANSSKKRLETFQLAVEEIAKCVVMCHNCHSLKTFENKCGREKQKSYYDSPEDFLIKNGKSTITHLHLQTINAIEQTIQEEIPQAVEQVLV